MSDLRSAGVVQGPLKRPSSALHDRATPARVGFRVTICTDSRLGERVTGVALGDRQTQQVLTLRLRVGDLEQDGADSGLTGSRKSKEMRVVIGGK